MARAGVSPVRGRGYTPPVRPLVEGNLVSRPARRARFLFFFALAVLFAIVAVQYCAKVIKQRKDGDTKSAILRWDKQFEEMQDGENIYAKYNYPNPPILPQLLTPIFKLIEVSPVVGAMTWFFLKLGMAAVCALWSFRLVETPGQPYPEWAKAIAVAAAINPVIGDLKHGNVNLFILFLVMAALYAFSRGKDVLSGLSLALAIAAKVTPALFVVYFARKLACRVLVGTAIGLLLFFLVIPSAVFAVQDGSVVGGCERNWAALTAWKKGMIDPYLIHGEVTSERENQSLPGVLTRLLSHEPSFSTYVGNVEAPQAHHNFADMDRNTIKRIVQGCQGIFVLLILFLCRAPIRAEPNAPADVRRGWRLAAEYSLILVGMLVFSERTWKHHCVMLMLPFAVISYGAFADGFSRRVRLVARVSLFTAAAAVLLPTMAEIFKNRTLIEIGTIEPGAVENLKSNPNSPRELAQVYGAYLWGFGALLIGLVTMLASREGRNAEAWASS
jgi:alpha-1,2-mannosyltransferase